LRTQIAGYIQEEVKKGNLTAADLKGPINETKAGGQVYRQMIKMQDEEYAMKVEVDMALRNIHQRHNPRLIGSKTRSADVQALSCKQRVKMLQKEGIITRAQHYKEDM
jgi:hypothetical protein